MPSRRRPGWWWFDPLTSLVEALTRPGAIVAKISDLPQAAIQAMRQTPAGEIPQIPVGLPGEA